MPIFMTVEKNMDALKAVGQKRHTAAIIPSGRHEMERIPNPFGYNNHWLVLKGTKIGGSEGSWRQWIDSDGCRVTIEEDGVLLTAVN